VGTLGMVDDLTWHWAAADEYADSIDQNSGSNSGLRVNYVPDQKSQPFVVPIVAIAPALQELHWR